MIETDTVLVLGAGASIPFGFPSGEKLKDNICGFLVDGENRDILKQRFTKNVIDGFIYKLMRSGGGSVDQFLEHQPKLVDIGKQCIALALLRHERTERLFDDWIALRSGKKTELESKDGKNWYDYLFEQLVTDFDDFGDNSLSIITFNYDRSLEHYLFTSLKNRYDKSDAECAEQLNKIPIIHVHGTFGRLPWEEQDIPGVPYDPIENVRRLCKEVPESSESRKQETTLREISRLVQLAAENIKIIHEGDVADAFGDAHDLLRNATRIRFLGFGFNETNVLRLLPEDIRGGSNMSGTCLEISPHLKENLWKIGMTTITQEMYFAPQTTYEFLFNNIKAALD